MEHLVEDGRNVSDNDDINDAESSEKFEKFIHELFEQNGILNDLRAYLRGHIVNVLKNAEAGNPPTCQRHFSQRLELTYQALNILIAEYLLRLEFRYSLSVFVSEIPLSNMVFEFAKTILKTKDLDIIDMQFGECDVWSVLNYLGIQCDSEHASRIVEMYNKSKELPLLLCILKCITLHDQPPIYNQLVNSSDESSFSDKTFDTDDEKNIKDKHRNELNKCKHYAFCKTCKSRKKRLKHRYEKKINKLEKIAKKFNVNNLNVDSFMKAVNVVEQSLIDEMFEQLKTVYEAEVEMIKEEGQKKIKRSITSHALLLQQHREQLEESFKEKEDKLEENVRQKKKFLWGLARALRDQHECMTKAMMEVKFETEKLVEKENELKNQLQEAEKILKSKGENMHCQISQEIKILAAHFESMKKERQTLDQQKVDLENLKQMNDKNDKILEEYQHNKEELKLNYDLLKEELDVLKKYIKDKNDESKCLVEKGTVMEEREEKTLMNNEVNIRINDENDDILKYQVINDFNKKNVNFNQVNLETNRPSSHQADIPEDCRCSDTLQMLKEENERLKIFSIQQSEHIDALSRERNFLQQQMTRTRPSPVLHHGFLGNRVNQYGNIENNRAGGEELYTFPNLQSRVLYPGEAVPFVGVLDDKRIDNRRYLINQWRALRRRRPVSSPPTYIPNPGQSIQSAPVCSFERNIPDNFENIYIQPSTSDTPTLNPTVSGKTIKGKSMKPVLHETKQKMQNTRVENIKVHPSVYREKSPNSSLHEAKLRLRKLEIEAEAVEKAYLEFRKRQSDTKKIKDDVTLPEALVSKEMVHLDTKEIKPTITPKEHKRTDDSHRSESPKLLKKDFDKYLREYQTKYDIGRLHFPNKNSILQKVKPIPTLSNNKIESDKNINYIETPIIEFRKLYQKDNSDIPVIRSLSDTENNVQENIEIVITPEAKCDEQTALLTLGTINYSISNVSKVISESEKDILEKDPVKDINDECNKSYLEVSEKYDILANKNENTQNYKVHDEIVCNNNEHFGENVEKRIENGDNLGLNESVGLKLKTDNKLIRNDENLLIVEVENVHNESNIKMSKSKDLLLIVESSIDNDTEENKENVISTQMTIIVSPKNKENIQIKNDLLNTIEKLTDNDVLNDIFHSNNNEEPSSVELSKKLENSSKVENSDEYGEDFSADVDNYNSQYDFGNNSPISVAKTSDADDDNFWNS